MNNEFKINDSVTWETLMKGIPVKKRGKIIYIVEPGEDLSSKVGDLSKKHRFFSVFNSGIREQLSYAVLVPSKNTIPRLYWPETEGLKKVGKIKGKKIKNEGDEKWSSL